RAKQGFVLAKRDAQPRAYPADIDPLSKRWVGTIQLGVAGIENVYDFLASHERIKTATTGRFNRPEVYCTYKFRFTADSCEVEAFTIVNSQRTVCCAAQLHCLFEHPVENGR